MDGCSIGRHIKEANLRKVKKDILDLKSEVLGRLRGDAKQAFASSDEEENDELDMHVFWRHQYRSNPDDLRAVRRRITQEEMKRLIGSQALQGQHESNCVHEFFSLVPGAEEEKTKLTTSNWT